MFHFLLFFKSAFHCSFLILSFSFLSFWGYTQFHSNSSEISERKKGGRERESGLKDWSLTNSLGYFDVTLTWNWHQLLKPKVTAHTQFAQFLTQVVRESKIKDIFKFHLSNSPKTYLLRNQVKVTSKYPNEFVRLQSFKAYTLSLPLFLPLSDLWGVGVKLYVPPERKERKW